MKKHQKPAKRHKTLTGKSVPDTIAVLFATAFSLHQQGHLAEAEALYQKILQASPKHFDALQLLATIALQEKNPADAVLLFDQVLSIDPGHPASLNNRGLALKKLKRWEEALESYNKAIAVKPDYVDAYFNRGVLFAELKQYDEALESYDRALAIKPNYTEAYDNREVVLKKQAEMRSDIAAIIKIKSRLRAIETMSIEEQRKVQDKQLRDLFRHAWQYSDWWRTRLSEAGYSQDTDGSVLPILQNIPVLLRTELQEHFEAIRAWRSDWSEKDIFTSTTSGSTGIPVRVEKYKALYNLIYAAVSLVDHEWHQRDARKPMACLTSGSPEHNLLPDWGPLFVELQGSGTVLSRLSLSYSPCEHADWLMEYCPTYLKSAPYRAAEIAEAILLDGQTLPLHQIISHAERVTPYQREVCRKAFGGAKIIDRYSCEEVGWLALQCPEHDHLHVMAGTTIIEIVDDHLKPCPVGVAGRVLVTNLHSYAMPIIRYDIGDIAEWGVECDCGIKFPVMSRLWGRKRNLIMLPDGKFKPMFYLGDDVAKMSMIKEYRLIQEKNGEIVFFVRASRPLSEEETETLRSYVLKIDTQLVVNIREVSVIDWGKGLKREEFVRLDM